MNNLVFSIAILSSLSLFAQLSSKTSFNDDKEVITNFRKLDWSSIEAQTKIVDFHTGDIQVAVSRFPLSKYESFPEVMVDKKSVYNFELPDVGGKIKCSGNLWTHIDAETRKNTFSLMVSGSDSKKIKSERDVLTTCMKGFIVLAQKRIGDKLETTTLAYKKKSNDGLQVNQSERSQKKEVLLNKQKNKKKIKVKIN